MAEAALGIAETYKLTPQSVGDTIQSWYFVFWTLKLQNAFLKWAIGKLVYGFLQTLKFEILKNAFLKWEIEKLFHGFVTISCYKILKNPSNNFLNHSFKTAFFEFSNSSNDFWENFLQKLKKKTKIEESKSFVVMKEIWTFWNKFTYVNHFQRLQE